MAEGDHVEMVNGMIMELDIDFAVRGRGATRGGSGAVALRGRARGRGSRQPYAHTSNTHFGHRNNQQSDWEVQTYLLPSAPDVRGHNRQQFVSSRSEGRRAIKPGQSALTTLQSDTQAAFDAILAEPRKGCKRKPEPPLVSIAIPSRIVSGGGGAARSLDRSYERLQDATPITLSDQRITSSRTASRFGLRQSQGDPIAEFQREINAAQRLHHRGKVDSSFYQEAARQTFRGHEELLYVPTGPASSRSKTSRGGFASRGSAYALEPSDAPEWGSNQFPTSKSRVHSVSVTTHAVSNSPVNTPSGSSRRAPRHIVKSLDRLPIEDNEMGERPMIDTFLGDLDRFARAQDGAALANYFVLEPDSQGEFPGSYPSIIQFVRNRFANEDQLETYCADRLSIGRAEIDGTQWYDFIRFTATYLKYLTLINPNNLLETYNLLSDLVKRCNAALRHGSLGIVILPTVVKCSRTLSTFAIHLDRNPKLTESVKRGGGEEGGGESLPELAANTIRTAFTTCFQDRSGPPSGVDAEGRPHGKKAGIYLLANLCLRILFQCRKLEAANIVFDQIVLYSPPLDVYPKAQQVTYLYYLGRFHFVTSHFHSAQAALSHAYALCPKNPLAVEYEALKQRRLILIYLTASNIILGRFPSAQLYSQQDAHGLRAHFEPLCQAIIKGDLTTFRRLTSFDSPHAPWFLRFRILLQLRNRCEVLVWRSLIRKIFILVGNQGNPAERKAPTLNLADIVQIMQLMEKRVLMPITVNDIGPGKRNTNWVHMDGSAPARQGRYVDPDFLDASGGSVLDEQNGIDPQNPVDVFLLPTMLEVEAVVASLIDQGLIGGFISHKQKRLAIQGARVKGALEAGFPEVWKVMKAKGDSNVPGWKRRAPVSSGRGGFGGGSLGPGSVVRLSGARPVGMGS